MPTNDNAAITTTRMAEMRTEWAFERTRLSNERTLIAWLRTGIAITAFGTVVPRLLSTVENDWIVRFISVLFVLCGTVVVYYGVHAYREMTRRLSDEQIGIPWKYVALLAGMIELGAILTLVLFLFS